MLKKTLVVGDRSGFGILVNNKKGKIFKGHFLKDKVERFH